MGSIIKQVFSCKDSDARCGISGFRIDQECSQVLSFASPPVTELVNQISFCYILFF
jgi:hypothetical protein